MSSSQLERRRGTLVSIEGLNGVGKTYLTHELTQSTPLPPPPLTIEAFTERREGNDLGRSLLRALVAASDGERFLRGGYPSSETLLLLAVKLHDFETARPHLCAGRTVIEGRSVHSVATYQSLILETDDECARARARRILATAARWRPLPDLTVLVTDEPAAAIRRAEERDDKLYTPEQWEMHLRAAVLFETLAADDPDHVRVLDRRNTDVATLLATVRRWIGQAPQRTWSAPDLDSDTAATRGVGG